MDGSQGDFFSRLEPSEVRRFLADNPEFIRADEGLLAELGLKVDAANVVDFGPAALARVHAAHQREAEQRQQVEETARANFAAQAQIHAAVVDVMDARSLAELATRVDEIARSRFGLAAAVLAVESDGRAPDGWRRLVPGQVDLILGGPLARMGLSPTALPLFGPRAADVQSMALVRMAIWEPACAAVVAFGSAEPDGFTPEMGTELVVFLARVVERTAERWPRP
jgi:uncharacterized protein YigA (DUF484 family)